MDKSIFKTMRDDIDAALAEVGKKYGYTLHAGNCTYDRDGNYFSFKLEGQKIGGESKAAKDFKMYARSFGLEPDDFGKTFRCSGKTYEITGLRIRATKKPIIAKCENGSEYVFPVEIIKSLLQKAA